MKSAGAAALILAIAVQSQAIAEVAPRADRQRADQPLSLLDFGADPTGHLPVDAAWRNFIEQMEVSGRAGYVPHGRYRFGQQAILDTAPAAERGLVLTCEGEGNTIFDVSDVPATPQFLIEASGGQAPTEHDPGRPKAAFYIQMRACGIQGNTNNVVLGVGQADLSDQLNNVSLDLWVANAGATSETAATVEINSVFNSDFKLTANASRSRGFGSAIRLKQSQFSQYFISAGNAGCAFYMTGTPSPFGYNYSNTIISPDFEEVTKDICIDSPRTARNVFIAGQYGYGPSAVGSPSAGAIDASAGFENVLISPNLTPTYGAPPLLFLRRVGITKIAGDTIDAAGDYRVTAPSIELSGRLSTTGSVQMPNLPTSAKGLPSGSLWNNSGVVNVVP